MRKLTAALWTAVVLAVGSVAHAAHAAHDSAQRVTLHSPAWMKPIVRRLSVCESRGNPRHEVHRSDWDGGGIVSWYVGTWRTDARGISNARYPWAEPDLSKQYRVALVSLAKHRDFGCLDYSWVRYG
jgi:hypothetical protein